MFPHATNASNRHKAPEWFAVSGPACDDRNSSDDLIVIPFQVSNSDNLTGIRLTTARYYTPSGESIQGKGIVPDIIIEQGEFESFNYKRFSESDLKDSLDKNNEEELEDNEDNELSEFEKRLELDYQLRRAFDLVQGVSLFNEIQE